MLRKASARLMLRATVAAPDFAAAVGRAATKLRTVVLTTAGLGLVDYGIWQWQPILGTIAAGVSLLILEFLTESKPDGKDGES